MGGSYLALGLFISSLTKNQIVAFLLTVIACFAAFILSAGIVIDSLGVLIGSVLKIIGLSSHFENLSRGVLDLRDIFHFIIFSFFFLFLNIQSLNSRNWR